MIYRPIGKTGMSASVVGLGTEHLDNAPYEQVEETISTALEHGINMMDVFMPGTPVRENIAKALGKRRKDVHLQGHIGSVDTNAQYDITRDVPTCKKYFDAFLRAFHTDYVDFGMMFMIDSEEEFKKVFDSDYIDYVLDLKRRGTIRAVGASSHNPEIARRIVETGIVELLMFSINMAYDMTPAKVDVLDSLKGDFDPSILNGIDCARADLYRLCEKKGVAITVMKTLGAGKLLSAEQTPFAHPMSVGQCIHYAVTRPAVVSALVGCENRKEVESAVEYLQLTEAQKDYSSIAETFNGSFKGECVYCNHCQPCPVGIDIGALTKYLDIARLDKENVPPSIRQHYAMLTHKGGECVACGLCEKRCPFGVSVIKNMKEAQAIFGS